MTSVDQLLETGLFNKLTGSSALISELGGTAIYKLIAPPSVSLPYLIFQWQGGGDENQTPSRLLNEIFTVKGVAGSNAKAHAIAEDIDNALHDQALTVTGWSNFWLAREGRVSYHEVEPDGQAVYHEGGMYRIRLGQ